MEECGAREVYFAELDDLRAQARWPSVLVISHGTDIAPSTVRSGFPTDPSKPRTVIRDPKLLITIVEYLRKRGGQKLVLDRRAVEQWERLRVAAVNDSAASGSGGELAEPSGRAEPASNTIVDSEGAAEPPPPDSPDPGRFRSSTWAVVALVACLIVAGTVAAGSYLRSDDERDAATEAPVTWTAEWSAGMSLGAMFHQQSISELGPHPNATC